VLDDGVEGVPLLAVVRDRLGVAEHDDGPVVHRVVERGTGQHEAVHEGGGQAHGDAPLEGFEHSAGRAPVHEHLVPGAGVDGRDHEGLPVAHEADVAHERLVQDRVHGGAVEVPARGQAAEGGAGGRFQVGHARRLLL
jgi:hypothetical protein